MKALTLISHLSMYLKGGSPQFRADLPKCISNSEAQIENGVAYKKKCVVPVESYKAVTSFSVRDYSFLF